MLTGSLGARRYLLGRGRTAERPSPPEEPGLNRMFRPATAMSATPRPRPATLSARRRSWPAPRAPLPLAHYGHPGVANSATTPTNCVYGLSVPRLIIDIRGLARHVHYPGRALLRTGLSAQVPARDGCSSSRCPGRDAQPPRIRGNGTSRTRPDHGSKSSPTGVLLLGWGCVTAPQHFFVRFYPSRQPAPNSRSM